MDENKNSLKSEQLSTPVAVIIVGVLIAGAIFFGMKSSNKAQINNNSGTQVTRQQPTQPIQQRTGPVVNISEVNLKGEPFIGNPNAPVVIAYWQCPFCKRFELQTLPTLINKYVITGKVKVVFKDYQFLGPDSQTAGIVAKAIWDLYPNSYFKWQTAMYNTQDGENSGFGNLKSILTLIHNKVPEMNPAKIAAQVEKYRSKYQQELDADKIEGSKFGINGTPGFIIGNQIVSGAQPTSVFTQIIDTELSKLK